MCPAGRPRDGDRAGAVPRERSPRDRPVCISVCEEVRRRTDAERTRQPEHLEDIPYVDHNGRSPAATEQNIVPRRGQRVCSRSRSPVNLNRIGILARNNVSAARECPGVVGSGPER